MTVEPNTAAATVLWYGRLETSNFVFDILDDNEARCRAGLQAAWQRHAMQTGATWTWADLADSIDVREVTVGAAYRNGFPVTTAP